VEFAPAADDVAPVESSPVVAASAADAI